MKNKYKIYRWKGDMDEGKPIRKMFYIKENST
jgi:hypothetical protein